jgi:hypothetical protein
VRATLALILCGTFWYLAVQDRPIPPILTDAALLVVAFYFGVRSIAPPLPVEPARASGWQPLFLPRGAVRTLLLLGFFSVIAWTWFREGSIDNSLFLMGQVLASYLVGVVVTFLANRRLRRARGRSAALALFRHVLAALALGVTGVVCASTIFGQPALPAVSENALAWTVSFYFGSRLAP